TRSDLNLALKFLLCLDIIMNPLFHTEFSISDSLKNVRKSVLIYETIILAVIIGFISCFAIMNLLNTIFTGVIVRQKEFALMRSVGMTQKQLTTMVCCEGLLIVSIGLILSLIVGGFIGYLLCTLLKNGLMTYLNYQFPFSVTLFYCALVVICSLLVSEIALRHQKNMSLIELLRR
ncbi:MAG: ABC transporter permease, partial [Blautia sp.]|nr:ABC transporter permease [Blautia sp.]